MQRNSAIAESDSMLSSSGRCDKAFKLGDGGGIVRAIICNTRRRLGPARPEFLPLFFDPGLDHLDAQRGLGQARIAVTGRIAQQVLIDQGRGQLPLQRIEQPPGHHRGR